MSKLIVLVGLPATGKSTFVENFLKETPTEWIVVSSDKYIEQFAKEAGKTYDDVYDDVKKLATKLYNEELNQAIIDRKNIIVDRTNLTANARASVLSRFSKDYEKAAIVFTKPYHREWKKRLANRPGKTIPEHVLGWFENTMERPTAEEGFDFIVDYKAD